MFLYEMPWYVPQMSVQGRLYCLHVHHLVSYYVLQLQKMEFNNSSGAALYSVNLARYLPFHYIGYFNVN